MNRLTLLLLLAALVLSCKKVDDIPLVIESFFAEPDSVFPGDTVNVTFTYSDPDGGNGIGITWHGEPGKWIEGLPSEPTSVLWIAPHEPGEYLITIEVYAGTEILSDSLKVFVMDTTGTFIDSRDGHEYKWAKIGSQIWMAENLAYLPSVSPPTIGWDATGFCYVYGYLGTDVNEAKNHPDYSTYGVLYNWSTAMDGTSSSSLTPSGVQGICPNGWHLPSDGEWKILELYLGMNPSDADQEMFRASGQVGIKLKSRNGWFEGGNGTNASGFNALPAGIRDANGNFEFGAFGGKDRIAYFWSTTTEYDPIARIRVLWYSETGICRMEDLKHSGLSVRCVKDQLK